MSDCAAFDAEATFLMHSTYGVTWDAKPERMHATRAVMALYEVRLAGYRGVSPCPRDPRGVVHASRIDGQ